MHGSSGLTRNFQPKPVFYAAAHLQRTLGDYRFARTIIDHPEDVMLLEFKHEKDLRRRIWVAWSPTGNHRSGTLELPEFDGVIERAEAMPFGVGQSAAVTLKGRRVPITESPVYLFLNLR